MMNHLLKAVAMTMVLSIYLISSTKATSIVVCDAGTSCDSNTCSNISIDSSGCLPLGDNSSLQVTCDGEQWTLYLSDNEICSNIIGTVTGNNNMCFSAPEGMNANLRVDCSSGPIISSSTGSSEESSSSSEYSGSSSSEPSSSSEYSGSSSSEPSSPSEYSGSSSDGSEPSSSSEYSGSPSSSDGSETSSSSGDSEYSGSSSSSGDSASSSGDSESASSSGSVESSSSGGVESSSSGGVESSSSGDVDSSSGNVDSYSSSGGFESSSSSGDIESSSSSGSVEPSSTDSSSGNIEPSLSSSGTDTPSSSSSGTGGNEDCRRGTYSFNGFAPCLPCPNNTYANVRETACTPCPPNTHAPTGAASLTECVCDAGFTSLWASGGPCYPGSQGGAFEYCDRGTFSQTGYKPCQECPTNTYANTFETECHACPLHSHTSSSRAASITECVCDAGYWSPWATGGPCYSNEAGTPNNNNTSNQNTSCSSYTDGYECSRDASCYANYAYLCATDRWEFVACQELNIQGLCQVANGSCAVNSAGDRALFATECLADGWSGADFDADLGSCCVPQHQPNNTGPTDNIGGCSFVNNSACVLLEYAGECPPMSSLNFWRIQIIEAVAEVVMRALNVSKTDATLGLTIHTVPRTNTGSESCAVHLQIFPPSTGTLTANDFMAAIWQQFNAGNDLSAQSSSLLGVATYTTFGDLKPKDDITPIESAAFSSIAVSSVTTIGVMAVVSIFNVV